MGSSPSMKEEPSQIRQRTRRWHFTVYKDLIHNTVLSHSARFLWVLLQSYTSKNSPQPFPSIRSLCQIMGTGKNRLYRFMQELQDHGYLEKEQQRVGGEFSSNLYALMDEPYLKDAETDSPCPPGGEAVDVTAAEGGEKNLRCPRPRATMDGNPWMGDHGRETKRYHSGRDNQSKKRAFASQRDAQTLLPVTRPERNGTGYGKPTSSAEPTADAVGEDGNFELDEKSLELQQLWDDYYRKVFRRKFQHTEDDLVALQYLAEEASPQEMMGLILSAWSFKQQPEGDYDPHFYCARYSQRPRDIWMTLPRHTASNLDEMRRELAWRSRKDQIDFGYQWFEKACGKPPVPAGS